MITNLFSSCYKKKQQKPPAYIQIFPIACDLEYQGKKKYLTWEMLAFNNDLWLLRKEKQA